VEITQPREDWAKKSKLQGFGQGMNLNLSSIIHDAICSLIHHKCHPKSYHSDIKYHMTLNIILSVVCFALMREESAKE
jgi:hypothetical protein